MGDIPGEIFRLVTVLFCCFMKTKLAKCLRGRLCQRNPSLRRRCCPHIPRGSENTQGPGPEQGGWSSAFCMVGPRKVLPECRQIHQGACEKHRSCPSLQRLWFCLWGCGTETCILKTAFVSLSSRTRNWGVRESTGALALDRSQFPHQSKEASNLRLGIGEEQG